MQLVRPGVNVCRFQSKLSKHFDNLPRPFHLMYNCKGILLECSRSALCWMWEFGLCWVLFFNDQGCYRCKENWVILCQVLQTKFLCWKIHCRVLSYLIRHSLLPLATVRLWTMSPHMLFSCFTIILLGITILNVLSALSDHTASFYRSVIYHYLKL